MINPLNLLGKFYDPHDKTYRLLVRHGKLVAQMALRCAERVAHLDPDKHFLEQAAYLHDIGIFMTRAHQLGCIGKYPYITQGYLGRELLEEVGLPHHALVCERHVGVGLSEADIRTQKLPLPARDMQPISLEERIICYTDNFFSKIGGHPPQQKSVVQVLAELKPFGRDKMNRFRQWVDWFGT